VKAGNQFYALAVGFAMAAGCWASEDVSGAIFNPAVSISIDFQNMRNGVGYGFCYVVAQVLGAFLAAVSYRVMRPHEEDDHQAWTTSRVTKTEGITTAKLAAEGAGTWLTVFTFGMTTLSKTYSNERPLSAAAALMSMHYALADVSGGHFNPAVTVSVLLSGRGWCSFRQGVAYIAVQIVCGSIAGLLFTAIRYPLAFPTNLNGILEKYGWLQLGTVDSIYAFVVCYAALGTITFSRGVKSSLSRNQFDGLSYGLASAAGGFAMLRLLNTLANPALTLGESLANAVTGKGSLWQGMWIAVFQIVGAVFASGVFRLTHAADFRRYDDLDKENTPLVDAVGKKAFEGDIDSRIPMGGRPSASASK